MKCTPFFQNNLLIFSPIYNSYTMMRQCWESVPEERPSFKTLYSNTSKIIEGIAGYLEMEFNPFTVQKVTEEKKEEQSTESSPREEETKEFNHQ